MRAPAVSSLALVLRERRAAAEQVLLNRAMRHDKGPVDRLFTRLVQTQLPDTSAVRPNHPAILDRRPPGVVSSDAVADSIVRQEPALTSTTEPTASASVTVAAPPERVYDLVSDLPRMGEWSPEATGGRWLGSKRGVGARFVGANRGARRWWPTTTVVTEATRGRRFAFDTKLGPITAAQWVYDIEPTDDGCTVTESWIDGRPGWLHVVGKHLTGVEDRVGHTQTMLETTLAKVKATAERG